MRAGVTTRRCTKHAARARLEQAREYLDVTGLYDGSAPEAQRAVAASNAVSAGIAAADAACCWALGEQNVGGHDGAVVLLGKVHGATQAANALRRLIDMKGEVQYVGRTNAADLRRAQRAARTVVDFAERVVT